MSGRLMRIGQWEVLAREANFRAARLADLCTVSLRQLERFFGSTFGQTPSAWLRAVQCRRARELIARGYSNKAAAIELKFASQSHFCREFKKAYGASPQMFSPAPQPGPENVAWDNRFREQRSEGSREPNLRF